MYFRQIYIFILAVSIFTIGCQKLVTDPGGSEPVIAEESGIKYWGGSFNDFGRGVFETTNSGYAVVGSQYSATTQADLLLVTFTSSLEFDGSRVLKEIIPVLQLNSIEDKIIEVEKTITFSASITDNSITNEVYSLENAPIDATIDSTTGKFIWTPSKSYGNIEDTIYNLSHQLKVKSVLVEIECPLSVALNGNPSLIEQLITNLVINSLGHGYPHYGGIIRIEWRFLESESAIALRYRDDGVGISPSISDKIFEPFFEMVTILST